MKTIILTITIFILLSSSAISQIIIEPSKGDRFDYFLNGDIWETRISYESKFALKVFISPEGHKSMWILNLSLTENEITKLMNYVDSLPDVIVYCCSKVSDIGKEDYKISSFDIYSGDNNSDYIDTSKTPDIFYLMKKIREYYKNK